jgi:RNA polymerase sigma factor (sigma-70 family)
MGEEPHEADEFCVRMLPALVGTLTLYCGRRDTAEELTQDVIVRVLATWPRVSSQRNPDAYVMRMAFNAANSWYRRRSAERRAYARSVVRDPEEVDATARIAVRRAVSRLPHRQRVTVILRYYNDLSVEHTATVMGCATGTVKAHTAKAIAALRSTDLFDEELSGHA